MTSVSGTSGTASLQAAKEAGKAAFFAELWRKEELNKAVKAEEAKAEAQQAAQKPVTVTLGGVAVTLEHEAAKELTAVLAAGAELLEASPSEEFELPSGVTATGAELTAALAALILAGKA